MVQAIIKRDGRQVEYDLNKITAAISKAMSACGRNNEEENKRLAGIVDRMLNERFSDHNPSVEEIQDLVEQVLMENGYAYVAKKYILYRAQRSQVRERNSSLMRIYNELTFTESKQSDMKRDNANIDGDTAMGTMLKYGSEGSKDFYEKYILRPEQSQAHRDGDIHIHDLDFYTLTTTCCQIELSKLFKGGFSTGHGFLREPQNISSYAALACIAIQSNQNDQHGGQSIVDFDYGLAKGVAKTFRKTYIQNLYSALKLLANSDITLSESEELLNEIENQSGIKTALKRNEEYAKAEKEVLKRYVNDESIINKIQDFVYNETVTQTDKATYKAMVALVHNLNTMHSRAGAQTPFSSINYGMDTSEEGRMVIKNVLLATEAGLGLGETPIFPIHIFRVKEGINYNPGEPNYDLFKLACRVSAKRLFPNFAFVDSPFNLQYYKPGHPETEVAYMGCRTRVMGNAVNPDKEVSYGRGNLSFTSINLPRIAIKSNKDINVFFNELEKMMDLVVRQLLDRFEIQRHKKVRNFPFLMGQGVWID
ncbi:MAG TPA: anaerobic ribonucleoside-triphosphate reductase, partial [Clostridia bacterium]